MRVIVFDLDGTLADTSADLLAAANHCFREMGHGDVLTPDRDAGVALTGGRAMLKAGHARLGLDYTEADLDAWYPVLLEAYDAAIDTHTVLYDGAREAVDRILARGDKVAICTNKPERLAEKLMTSLDFRSPFASLLGADSLAVRKPDPAHLVETVKRAGGVMEKCLLVGDTVTDRATAAAAEVPSVLVTFGPAGGDMAALKPEALLAHYDDLDATIDRLLP